MESCTFDATMVGSAVWKPEVSGGLVMVTEESVLVNCTMPLTLTAPAGTVTALPEGRPGSVGPVYVPVMVGAAPEVVWSIGRMDSGRQGTVAGPWK